MGININDGDSIFNYKNTNKLTDILSKLKDGSKVKVTVVRENEQLGLLESGARMIKMGMFSKELKADVILRIEGNDIDGKPTVFYTRLLLSKKYFIFDNENQMKNELGLAIAAMQKTVKIALDDKNLSYCKEVDASSGKSIALVTLDFAKKNKSEGFWSFLTKISSLIKNNDLDNLAIKCSVAEVKGDITEDDIPDIKIESESEQSRAASYGPYKEALKIENLSYDDVLLVKKTHENEESLQSNFNRNVDETDIFVENQGSFEFSFDRKVDLDGMDVDVAGKNYFIPKGFKSEYFRLGTVHIGEKILRGEEQLKQAFLPELFNLLNSPINSTKHSLASCASVLTSQTMMAEYIKELHKLNTAETMLASPKDKRGLELLYISQNETTIRIVHKQSRIDADSSTTNVKGVRLFRASVDVQKKDLQKVLEELEHPTSNEPTILLPNTRIHFQLSSSIAGADESKLLESARKELPHFLPESDMLGSAQNTA